VRSVGLLVAALAGPRLTAARAVAAERRLDLRRL